MKNYLKISILSLLAISTSMLFTACEADNETVDASSTELSSEETSALTSNDFLTYNYAGVDVTEVSRRDIAIRGNESNLYLSSENGNGSVTMNRTSIGSWETFNMVTFDDGTVTFIGNNDKFMHLSTSGAYPPSMSASSLNAFSIFEIEYHREYRGYTVAPRFAQAYYMNDNTDCTVTNVQFGIFCFGDLNFSSTTVNEGTTFRFVRR